MAEVLLFHHAHGFTEGVRVFADMLRDAGHIVHTPDLFDGRHFTELAQGLAYVDEVGLDQIVRRGCQAAEALPEAVVYAGFSLGVVPAQRLAATRTGARGALLYHSCIPLSESDGGWPDGVPVHVHAMESDPWFIESGDLEAARSLVATTSQAQLFLYPGSGHLFADPTLPDYDAAAAAQLTRRTIGLLDGIDRATPR